VIHGRKKNLHPSLVCFYMGALFSLNHCKFESPIFAFWSSTPVPRGCFPCSAAVLHFTEWARGREQREKCVFPALHLRWCISSRYQSAARRLFSFSRLFALVKGLLECISPLFGLPPPHCIGICFRAAPTRRQQPRYLDFQIQNTFIGSKLRLSDNVCIRPELYLRRLHTSVTRVLLVRCAATQFVQRGG
jgi:hypothetical protein